MYVNHTRANNDLTVISLLVKSVYLHV